MPVPTRYLEISILGLHDNLDPAELRAQRQSSDSVTKGFRVPKKIEGSPIFIFATRAITVGNIFHACEVLLFNDRPFSSQRSFFFEKFCSTPCGEFLYRSTAFRLRYNQSQKTWHNEGARVWTVGPKTQSRFIACDN